MKIDKQWKSNTSTNKLKCGSTNKQINDKTREYREITHSTKYDRLKETCMDRKIHSSKHCDRSSNWHRTDGSMIPINKLIALTTCENEYELSTGNIHSI